MSEAFEAIEELTAEALEIIGSHPEINTRPIRITHAHSVYMQGRLEEAIKLFGPFKDDKYALANLCVSLVKTKQNEKAEALLGNAENGDAFAIASLAVAMLYVSRGQIEFGVTLALRAVTEDTCTDEAWYYLKQCVASLIEKLIQRSAKMSEQLYKEVIEFLDRAMRWRVREEAALLKKVLMSLYFK